MNFNRITNIPTREEFHRAYAGEISIEDFCTHRSKKRRAPHYTLEERRQQSSSKKLRQ
jgi:hypothetical protein